MKNWIKKIIARLRTRRVPVEERCSYSGCAKYGCAQERLLGLGRCK